METVASVMHHMFVGHFRDYDKWPWAHFNSVEKQMMEHPSFIVAEVLFITVAALSLWHACTTSDANSARRLMLTWLTALVAGTVNDYFFMLLPVVDNFWQAQAVIMLTPRMPLYIPCVYITFMYWPNVLAARVFHFANKDILAEACFAGLLAGIIYAPYDVNGARFLWWTWHQTDPGVQLRWLGVPAGSTLWTITFTSSMSLILRLGSERGFSQGATLALGCLSVLLMLVVINPFCILGSFLGQDKVGMPGPCSLCLAIFILSAVVIHRIVNPREKSTPSTCPAEPERPAVRNGIICYFAVHALVMATFSPENQMSTGVHQLYGPCGAFDMDMMGFPRVKYICKEKYPDWYFGFECLNQAERITPEEALETVGTEKLASWYTVCGKPHESWSRWMLAETVLTTWGAILCTLSLGYSSNGGPGAIPSKTACSAAAQTVTADAGNDAIVRGRQPQETPLVRRSREATPVRTARNHKND